jgi:glycosyltransferase 2 family protein
MKKAVLTLLKVVVSLGILAYIFTKVVDIRQLWSKLIQANLFYVAAAVAVYFLVQGLSAYRWWLLLRPQGIQVRFSKILSFYFLGMYFNFFLPSAIGGDVFKVYYLNKETNRLSASTASVFFDRDIGMGGLVLIATLAAIFAGTNVNGVPLLPIFGIIGLGFIAANLALFYRPTYALLHKALSLFKMKKVDEKIERLFDSVNAYRGKWGLIAITMAMSIGVQIGCAFVNMLAARAIGFDKAGWADYLVFIPTIGLISMIPISVGGTGWREGAYILFFQLAGATPDQAAALSVVWLGVVALTSLPGGVIYVARGSRKEDRPPVEDEILEESGAAKELANYKDGGEHFSTLPPPPREEEPASTI